MQPDDRGRRPNGYMAAMPENTAHDVTKCMNYLFCGTSDLPDQWYNVKGHYVCTNCDTMRLGVIQFSNGECAVCMEDDVTLVTHPNCIHKTCIKCFRRLMSWHTDVDYPVFPYSDDVCDLYAELNEDTPEYEEFITKYPLIATWDEDCCAADTARDENYERESNLRCCPICRAPFYKTSDSDKPSLGMKYTELS